MNARLDRRTSLSTPIGRWDRMHEIRLVEESIQRLYADGHVRGSTHLAIGQEAVSVGIAAVLRPDDVVTCTYRGHAMALALGLTPIEVLGEICGRVVGCSGGLGGSMHLCGPDVGLMPTFAIVGAGAPVAAGAALSAQQLGTGLVALTVFGDGAANIGAVHETLNLAAVWKLPMVFVVENNLYGEYSRIELTTPIEDLAVRADGYAMPSAIVNGQDVDMVIAAVDEAVGRARAGDGPTLLEMKTYRYCGHSRSDAATYRPAGELNEWLTRDPIDLAGAALVSAGTASQGDLDRHREDLEHEIGTAVERVLASDGPPANEAFAHVTA